MSNEIQTSHKLEDFICSIEDTPVLPKTEDAPSIEQYIKYSKQANENSRTKAILDTWKGQQKAERTLRNKYANCFMWFLGIQLLVLNVIFVLVGIGILQYEQWTVNIFIISVFGEIVSTVSIIVRNLFKSTNKEMIDLIKDQK